MLYSVDNSNNFFLLHLNFTLPFFFFYNKDATKRFYVVTVMNASTFCLRHRSSLDVDRLWSQRDCFSDRARRQDPEVENAALQQLIKNLKSQIAIERSRREAAERESELTIRENQGLEDQLAVLDGCRARQKELEAEVEQLRLRWRADCANR